MQKTFATIGSIFILIFSLILSPIVSSDNSTIYVDDDNTQGPWDGTQEHPYQSIQDAIDVATSGDNVYVYPGEYEIFQVDKSITIQGADVENTIINVTGESWINSDFVQIYGLKFVGIEGTGLDSYITIDEYDNITISNCVFTSGLHGIEIHHSKHITISDCQFSTNYYGIRLNGQRGSTPNRFLEDVVVDNCNFFRSQIEIIGSETKDVVVSNCSFTEYGLGYHTLEAVQIGGVEQNTTIQNCYFQRNGLGIGLQDSHNIVIKKCVFYEHIRDYEDSLATGIHLEVHSNSNIIHSNVFAYNTWGVSMDENCVNNLVYDNTFYQNLRGASDGGPTSTWYNQELGIGNYWSDYKGVDGDGDGIGDTPYELSEGNYDMYPKMNFDDQIRPPTPSAPIVSKNVLKKYENAEFSCSVPDPNGDDVFYKFFWEDPTKDIWYGPYPSGAECKVLHSFDKSGIYDVKVAAKDIHDDETLRSEPTTIKVSIPSNPEISGPTEGVPGKSYTYEIKSADPDGDPIWYKICWAWPAEDYSDWIGPYESGVTIKFNHTWTEEGTKDIRIGAKDIDGAASGWSKIVVKMPKQKFKNFKFLDRIVEIFPFLKIFLKRVNLITISLIQKQS
jgi:parallel beta-helix repeat protein